MRAASPGGSLRVEARAARPPRRAAARRPARLARLGRVRGARRVVGRRPARRAARRDRLHRRGRARGEARRRAAVRGRRTVGGARLAGRRGRDGSRPSGFGLRPVEPRRALRGGRRRRARCSPRVRGCSRSLGALGGVRVPRELSRLDTLSWTAGFGEPPVPFDAAAVASLLGRAVLGVAVLELVLRGVALPSLARLARPVAGDRRHRAARRRLVRRDRRRRPAAGARARARPAARPARRRHRLDRPRRRRSPPGSRGAALAGACGWGPLGAARRRRSPAPMLVAGVLLAVAGGAAPRRGRAPAGAARPRLAAERGQTARRVDGHAAARRDGRRRAVRAGTAHADRQPHGAADLPDRRRGLHGPAGGGRQGVPRQPRRRARAARRSPSRS